MGTNIGSFLFACHVRGSVKIFFTKHYGAPPKIKVLKGIKAFLKNSGGLWFLA